MTANLAKDIDGAGGANRRLRCFFVLRGSGCSCPGAAGATKSAVVLSQARGNGVYEKFSEDTFTAAPAQEPAVICTCCASLKAGLSTLSRTKSHSSATIDAVARPRLRKIARRVS